MDVPMSEMDGLEATAKVREKEQLTGEHQPVVALTAHAMKGDHERRLSVGMDGYFNETRPPTRARRSPRSVRAEAEDS
jgi:two-component system sensor histidine kinase/response regulator